MLVPYVSIEPESQKQDSKRPLNDIEAAKAAVSTPKMQQKAFLYLVGGHGTENTCQCFDPESRRMKVRA